MATDWVAPDLYTWTQKGELVTVIIELPKIQATRNKDIPQSWSLKGDGLSLQINGRTVLEGKLYAPCYKEDTTYTIDQNYPNKTVVQIEIFKKEKERHWFVVIRGSLGDEYNKKAIDPQSMYHLARMEEMRYQEPIISREQRLQCLKDSAEYGNARALFDLGCILYGAPESLAFVPYYRALPPVEPDYQQAIICFDRHLSMRPKALEASKLIGQLYVKLKDYLSAKPHLEIAANHYPNCTYEYACVLEQLHTPQDLVEKWFKIAANSGSYRAVSRMIDVNTTNLYGIPVAKAWSQKMGDPEELRERIREAEDKFRKPLDDQYIAGLKAKDGIVQFTAGVEERYPFAFIQLINSNISQAKFEEARKWAEKAQPFLLSEEWVVYWQTAILKREGGVTEHGTATIDFLRSALDHINKIEKEYQDEQKRIKQVVGFGALAVAVAAGFWYFTKDE